MARFAPLLAAVFLGPASAPALAQAPGFVVERLHQVFPGIDVRMDLLLAGDLDGDGDVDLLGDRLYGASGTAKLLVRNQGALQFVPQWREGPDSTREVSLLLADFDADGFADLLTSRRSNTTGRHKLLIYWNPGDGELFAGEPTILPHDGKRGFSSARVGDLDGDGDLDVVPLQLGISPNSWVPDALLIHDGARGFTLVREGLPPSAGSSVGHLLDFDGDGDLDLLRRGIHRLVLWTNEGDGTFVEGAEQPPVPVDSDAATLQVLDIDGDGSPDLLSGNPPVLYRNDGTGVFLDEGAVLPPVSYPRGVEPADLDGDGRDDLVVFEADGAVHGCCSKLYFGRGDHFEPSAEPAEFAGVWADLDDDGDLDSVTAAPEVWLNDGAGGFVQVVDEIWGGPRSHVWRVRDQDGDGFPDFTSCDVESEVNTDFRNDRTGDFEPIPTCPWPVSCREVIAELDLDGDGDEDLLHAGVPSVARNDGSCVWTLLTEDVPEIPFGLPLVRTFDLEGDGDVDLLIHDFLRLSLWRNEGGMRFTDASGELPAQGLPSLAIAGDVDGDGDLDLLVAYYAGQVEVWWNDGRGSFSAEPLPPLTNMAWAGLLIDVDADRDLDVLLIDGRDPNSCSLFEYCPSRTAYFRNDGKAGFTDVSESWGEVSLASDGIQPVDLDRDGNLDLFERLSRRVWLNDGSGVFARVDLENAYFAYAVDLDGDDDFDLLNGVVEPRSSRYESRYFAPARALVNLERHVSWRMPPRVGQPLDIDLAGPAGLRWSLLGSPSLGPGKRTVRGLFLLDPRTTWHLARGLFDEEGRASLRFQVPADPGLVGRTFFLQALAGASWTNATRVTLTGL